MDDLEESGVGSKRSKRSNKIKEDKGKSFATKELLEKARFSPGLAEDRPVSGLSNSKGPVSFSLSLSFSFLFVSWFNTFPSFFTCPPVYDCDGGVGRGGWGWIGDVVVSNDRKEGWEGRG